MKPVRDTNGFARWDYCDLIRLAATNNFSPEDYLRAASVRGSFEGLPLAPAALRALSIPNAEGVGLIKRDATYLRAWAERTGLETWSAPAMLVAAIVPARLPWAEDLETVLISKERWPEGFERFQFLALQYADRITVGDLALLLPGTNPALRVALEGLRRARIGNIARSVMTTNAELLRRLAQ